MVPQITQTSLGKYNLFEEILNIDPSHILLFSFKTPYFPLPYPELLLASPIIS